MQFLYLAAYLLVVFLLLFCECQFVILGIQVHLQFIDAVVIAVFLLQFLLVFLIFTVFLVLQEEPFSQFVPFLRRVFDKGVEVLLVVFDDGLVDNLVFDLRRFLVSLEY